MFEIDNLSAVIAGKRVLDGVCLRLQPGQVCAIMGPNGAGKSSLSKVVAGHPDYEVRSGRITLEVNGRDKDLLSLSPQERAREGVFLALQYPVEVPGVQNIEFMRAAFNAVTRHQGGEEMDPLDFLEFAKAKAEQLQIKPDFLERQVNVDFSGGEKKRNEILQMAVLAPRVAFLDETDSGLDVDALRQVAAGIRALHRPDQAIVLITHYHRLLELVKPDTIHIMAQGRIVYSGGSALALEIERRGYEAFIPGGGAP